MTTNNVHRAGGIDVGQGSWELIDARRYHVSIVFFVFNDDGSSAGTIEVRHVVSLATDQTYVGEGHVSVRAPDGAVITGGPFTSRGRRM